MSSSYGPGESVVIQAQTQNTSGEEIDATGLPTAVLIRNGVDTAETVVVAKVALLTGVYSVAWTIPSAWAIGDTVEVRFSAVVSGLTGSAVVWSNRLGNDFIQGPVSGTAVGADVGSAPITLLTFQKAEKTFALELLDASDDPIDASGFELRFVVESLDADSVVQIDVLESDGDITVSGDGSNVVNVKINETETASIEAGEFRWRLWDDSVKQVLLHGPFHVLATSEA